MQPDDPARQFNAKGSGMSTIGEALIEHLAAHDVEVIFGIPGVHTIELYRGLSQHIIRHVTPRHEQGAGFMADGYARVTGKPGVALVITGPGVTNTLTPIAQARADSIPMLVVSSVNSIASLGKGLGHLHELPDQQSTVGSIASPSIRLESQNDLAPAIEAIFNGFARERPGPAHIEVPLDIAMHEAPREDFSAKQDSGPVAGRREIERAAELLKSARSPVILAGGGMRFGGRELEAFARRLDAPVVLTVNARGLMHGHGLVVPASPSIGAVRELIEGADAVLAFGTELGRTDFDMYDQGLIPVMNRLIRVDICPHQLARHEGELKIHADARKTITALLESLPTRPRGKGVARAARTRAKAREEIGEEMRSISDLLGTIRDIIPNSIMVGDSTQPVYAGNLYYDHDRPAGWFNAATGYGALGYGVPAAIGAAIGEPEARVICLSGDGGIQFCLAELMVAVDENLPIIFIVWNNRGYQEIERSMRNAGVNVIGCNPTPPDFSMIAAACGMPFSHCDTNPENVATVIGEALAESKPVLIEIRVMESTIS